MTTPTPEPLVSRRHAAWLAVLILLGILFWFLPPIAAEQDAVYRTFTPLVTIKSLIQKYYVEEVPDEKLIDGAIHGLVQELDPFSQYFSPAEYAIFQERTQGGYVGVGVWLEPASEQLVVASPIQSGPAFEAGVQAGDVIIEIGGVSVLGMTHPEAAERLRGVEGSTAYFKVLRLGQSEPIDFAVQRRVVKTPSIRGFQRRSDLEEDFLIDPQHKIGYLRITEFWETSVGEFDQVMNHLQQQGIRAMVFDVRFNPGGDIQAVADMLDRFLSEGLIVSTRNRREVEATYQATPEHDLPHWPVAVLINEASASGAEIFAGVLQDYERAIVVGERSFGKGSVQTPIELPDRQSAIKLTTAYYYLPKGRRIHRRVGYAESDDWGVLPDHVVPLSREETSNLWNSLTRAVISNHRQPRDQEIFPDRDPQLHKAMELLREKLKP